MGSLYTVMYIVPELLVGLIFAWVAIKYFSARSPLGKPGTYALGVMGAFVGEFLILHLPIHLNPDFLHSVFGIVAGIFSILFLLAGHLLTKNPADRSPSSR